MRRVVAWIAVVLCWANGVVYAQPAPRRATKPAPIVRRESAAAQPLSARERAEQMLSRFTYGARPGEVDRVLAMGPDAWFERQLNPESIPDAAYQRRVADLPTVAMSPAQALGVFPDRSQVAAVAQGKAPLPTDPLQRAVIEAQVAKWKAEQVPQPSTTAPANTPAYAASLTGTAGTQAVVVDGRALALQDAGRLLALPRDQRLAALLALPVEQRVALTSNGNLPGPVRAQLLREASPRERELFEAMAAPVGATGRLADELAQARMLRDILSERQLQTVMTDLWFNHFNVLVSKEADRWYTASYEREVIRPHALGKFRDLLLATATSPAMMVYLDNLRSLGPDSLANGVNPAKPNGKRGNRGLNENYGREVMELHTIGVNGGYSQADVTALASILTGWGVERPQDGGPFSFEPRRHEPGAKAWWGYCITDDGKASKLPAGPAAAHACDEGSSPVSPASMQQGVTALTILAASPQCARFISTMLAEYFVADTPPASVVDRLTAVYLSRDGDIKALLRALVQTPEFSARVNFRNKVKTPVEFLASAYRATGTDPQNVGALVNEARVMGMPPYNALPPTGYVLSADHWMNSTALVDRLNFAYTLTSGKLPNQGFDAPQLLAAAMLAPGALAPNDAVAVAGPVHVAGTPTGKNKVGWMTVASGSKERKDTQTGTNGTPLEGGTALATRVLERSIAGGPVSPGTDALVRAQVAQQKPDASATETLNLIAGLLLGSPEFQRR